MYIKMIHVKTFPNIILQTAGVKHNTEEDKFRISQTKHVLVLVLVPNEEKPKGSDRGGGEEALTFIRSQM